MKVTINQTHHLVGLPSVDVENAPKQIERQPFVLTLTDQRCDIFRQTTAAEAAARFQKTCDGACAFARPPHGKVRSLVHAAHVNRIHPPTDAHSRTISLENEIIVASTALDAYDHLRRRWLVKMRGTDTSNLNKLAGEAWVRRSIPSTSRSGEKIRDGRAFGQEFGSSVQIPLRGLSRCRLVPAFTTQSSYRGSRCF